ncbi:MAG: hypothetical protein F6K36_06045 [Symploca sp. SIO3C6]|nr:hypothetical protein [Symploca sp. SIO3C6]
MIEAVLNDTLLIAGTLLCPLSLLALLVGFLYAVGVAWRESCVRLKQLHSIPCDRCVYFTGCHYLKCTVHPCKALTEDAVDCLDFEPTLYSKPCFSNHCKS